MRDRMEFEECGKRSTPGTSMNIDEQNKINKASCLPINQQIRLFDFHHEKIIQQFYVRPARQS